VLIGKNIKTMSDFKGKKVLITGGASGIGKIMGRLVLERGGELIIWDINKKKIDETFAQLTKLGKVATYCVDLSQIDQIIETAARVKIEVGKVSILINNAAIVTGNYFHQHNHADIAATIQINTLAPMHVASVFLPEMMTSQNGHICNVASLAGLISNPKMSVYAASKWAMIGWSDSLRLEMKKLKANVRVTTVNSYYIKTEMFAGVKSVIPILDPEKVAEKIIHAIEKDRISLSMPWSMRFVRFLEGLLPISWFDAIVGNALGIYKTMDNFAERQKK
jgi:short-subunit dehydrogenase